MLLKKHEKNGKIKVMYKSSNICASTYETASKKLTIIFCNGGQYLYTDVSAADYMRFELADSQGQVLNSHIKKYAFEKLDAVDTKVILEEINVIQDAEDKAKLDALTGMLILRTKNLTNIYDSTQGISLNHLKELKTAIENYETHVATKLDKVNG
jgi:hypothetical protein